MRSMGLDCKLETEELERYPYVMENISKRGIKGRWRYVRDAGNQSGSP